MMLVVAAAVVEMWMPTNMALIYTPDDILIHAYLLLLLLLAHLFYLFSLLIHLNTHTHTSIIRILHGLTIYLPLLVVPLLPAPLLSTVSLSRQESLQLWVVSWLQDRHEHHGSHFQRQPRISR